MSNCRVVLGSKEERPRESDEQGQAAGEHGVIKRLYVHNFRCMENFELELGGASSSLLIGPNGSGKSSVGLVLELLQSIARGEARLGRLLSPKDFTRGRRDVPMRFELEAVVAGTSFHYALALELPPRFKELRVLEERLTAGGEDLFSRDQAEVSLARGGGATARFLVDWHLAALPVIQEPASDDPLAVFRSWLARMLVLAPVPSRISGESAGDVEFLARDCANLAGALSHLLRTHPAAYARVERYLRTVMPELLDVTNPPVGGDARRLTLRFAAAEDPASALAPAFEDLSDGEKCFVVCAVVLAKAEVEGPLFTFWDEPDAHLAPSEVQHFVRALRRSARGGSQLLVSSHHGETMRAFSDETTFLLHRRSRLEPAGVRRLDEIGARGDLVASITRGDLVP